MKTFAFIFSLYALSFSLLLNTESRAEDAPFDDSMENVLHFGIFELAEMLGDTSEAGQNHAARILAEARRIRTESHLAQESVQRVLVTSLWRRALNDWHNAQYDMIFLHQGGGTMWLHIQQRNVLLVEEFLEGIARKFPLEPSKVPDSVQTRLEALFDEANVRLALAERAARGSRLSHPEAIEGYRNRLETAQQQLVHAFHYAGDKETSKKLLEECISYTTGWDIVAPLK